MPLPVGMTVCKKPWRSWPTCPNAAQWPKTNPEQLGITLHQMLYGRRRGVYRILFSIERDIVTLHYVRHSARGPIEQ
jgi:hypothetical protein